jgi:hypothetical protein
MRAEQISRQIAEHTEELNSLMRERRSGWMQAEDTMSPIERDEILEEILKSSLVRNEPTQLRIYGDIVATPLLPTEDRRRRFLYAIARSIKKTHVRNAVKFFLNATDVAKKVVAISTDAFLEGNAQQHVASILSTCLSKRGATRVYPLADVVYPNTDVCCSRLKDDIPDDDIPDEVDNTPVVPIEQRPAVQVSCVEDDQLYAACFQYDNAVFFTLRYKTCTPSFEFSWSTQLQCPLEFDNTSEWVHLPDLVDTHSYGSVCIQRFESFKLKNKQQMSYDLFHARVLVRPLKETTYAYNPWVPMGDETPELLLAGCLHQIYRLRNNPRGSHSFSTYYFREMSSISLMVDVFQAVFGTAFVADESVRYVWLRSMIPNEGFFEYRACIDSAHQQIDVTFD